MNISYEAYRVFYYTAKTRSFTQAANALGNSQPNITRIIKNLERELGCTLFLRNNRHVELTAEGETLYRHVSAAFEQLQAGEEALLRGGGLDGGILRIAATEIALHVFLLPVLSRFRGRYPGVHIKLFNGSTPAAIDELKKSVDKSKAKAFFEAYEQTKLIPPKVNMKTDQLLRQFILTGGFEVDMP